MKTDYQLAEIVMSLYNEEDIFDISDTIDGDDNFGFISYPDHDVIALEGTHDIPDVEDDLDIRMIFPIELKGAGVHEGGYLGLPEVKELLTPHISKTRPIYVIGHSLGAIRAYHLAAILIEDGYNVIVVVWGPPRAGDQKLADIIAKVPNRSYWNYHDEFNHDPFGCVPVFVPFVAEYVVTGDRTIVKRWPDPHDKWGPKIGWHHMQYYKEVTPK